MTPTTAFKTSMFYDANNNPLNIPCEGPKVVPVTLPFNAYVSDSQYVINFAQLFLQNQLSALQSVSIDLTNQGANFGSIVLLQGGTEQQINVSGTFSGLFHSPLCCTIPPVIRVYPSNNSSTNFPLQLFFMNYLSPISNAVQ